MLWEYKNKNILNIKDLCIKIKIDGFFFRMWKNQERLRYFLNKIFTTPISLEAKSFPWVYPTLQLFLSLYSIFFQMLVKNQIVLFWYVGMTIFLWSSSVNSLPYGCLLPHGGHLPINQSTWLFSSPPSLPCFRQMFGIHILSTQGFLSYYKIFPWASKNGSPYIS